MPRSAATPSAPSTRSCAVVEARWRAETPAAIKIRWDGDRTQAGPSTSPATSPRRRRCASWWATTSRSAFDANNGYSVGGAMRVGRALEELGYVWFEEPVQHYHVRGDGRGRAAARHHRLGRRSRPTRSQALVDLINAGVRMVQPDIVKMGGITGLMQCAAICLRARRRTRAAPDAADASATSPTCTCWRRSCTSPSRPSSPIRTTACIVAFENPPMPQNGTFAIPDGPGLGLRVRDAEIDRRRT